jgi:hypothetical protein
VRSCVSSLNFQYPIFSLRSPSSCLRLLPFMPITSIPISVFHFKMLCKYMGKSGVCKIRCLQRAQVQEKPTYSTNSKTNLCRVTAQKTGQ